MKPPALVLLIDFNPGEVVQKWSVVATPGPIRNGEGTPDQIARDVCAIAKGAGASIRE
jgi:hypothetical protein